MADQKQSLHQVHESLPRQYVIHSFAIWPDADEDVKKGCALAIDGQLVKEIGTSESLSSKYKNWLHVDANDYLIIPGLINAHTHVTLGFLRGVGQVTPSRKDELSLIETLLFPAEEKLTPPLTKSLSYPCILEGLKHGVTTFVDHYYYSEEVGKAMRDIGVRGFLAETIADLGGAKPGEESWARAKNLVENWPFPADELSPVIGPHATDTISAALLKKSAAFAREQKLPLHMHLSQTQGERTRTLKKDGMSPVKLAAQSGCLSENALVVHLLSVDDEDLKIIKDSGATIGFCPSSQILYENCADITRFMENEIPVAVATDCSVSNDAFDPLIEAKIAALMLKSQSHSRFSLTPSQTFASISKVPARVLGMENKIGTLTEGAFADFAMIKKDLSWAPHDNIERKLVFSHLSKYVRHVFVNGKIKLFEGEHHSGQEDKWLHDFNAAYNEIMSLVKV